MHCSIQLKNYEVFTFTIPQQIHGLEQPSWVTPDVMTRISDLEHYTLVLFFDSKEKQRLSAGNNIIINFTLCSLLILHLIMCSGVWLNEVLDNINEKTANPEQDMKLFLYSAVSSQGYSYTQL